jgi:hypothetical protein
MACGAQLLRDGTTFAQRWSWFARSDEVNIRHRVFAMLLFAAGCGADTAADQAVESKRVYWDAETRGPVAADVSAESPAVHPATGRRTLMPALYCARCNEWRAVPPLAEVQRNPKSRICAKCKGSLVADGPPPPSETEGVESE